mmetsp:Transcript_13247/g.33063  ORF Transcript_13247/g.33063 Transcript_13247/m.33063 type:complete len:240 (-) Transcript_13247:7-726(-)
MTRVGAPPPQPPIHFPLTEEQRADLRMWFDTFLPGEAEEISKKRKVAHKRLWNLMGKQKWKTCQAEIEVFHEREIPYDEATFTLFIFHELMSTWRDSRGAMEILVHMREAQFVHPSYVRMMEGLLLSLTELATLDAEANRDNLRRAARSMWHIAVKFKRRRMRLVKQYILESLSRGEQPSTDPALIQRLAIFGHNEAVPSRGDGPDIPFVGLIPEPGVDTPRHKRPAPRPVPRLQSKWP